MSEKNVTYMSEWLAARKRDESSRAEKSAEEREHEKGDCLHNLAGLYRTFVMPLPDRIQDLGRSVETRDILLRSHLYDVQRYTAWISKMQPTPPFSIAEVRLFGSLRVESDDMRTQILTVIQDAQIWQQALQPYSHLQSEEPFGKLLDPIAQILQPIAQAPYELYETDKYLVLFKAAEESLTTTGTEAALEKLNSQL
jgi:hypothetical protein